MSFGAGGVEVMDKNMDNGNCHRFHRTAKATLVRFH